MASNFLPDTVRPDLDEIGQADLLIGVPSFNNAGTIEAVGKAIAAGLLRFFPRARAVIVNTDGGSQDETAQLLRRAMGDAHAVVEVQHPVPTVHPLVMPDHGVPGYENALRTLFEIAEALQVKACAVVDGNIRSVTDEWVGLLLNPINEHDFDLVVPLYSRHKFDGSLTNSVIYPLSRALYGKRLRYQGGGALGFSPRLAARYRTKERRGAAVAPLGMENWLTTVAVAEGYRVCQASLGFRAQESRAAGVDLSMLLSHAVGSAFALMDEYQTVWEACRGSEQVRTFGPVYECGVEVVSVDPGRMVRALQQGLRDLLPLWEIILTSEAVSQILLLGLLDVDEFRFPPDLWVQVIYDFALAFHDKVVHREHLLKALTPLYLGRTASFVLEHMESGSDVVEGAIERLCVQYETQKPYLVERWR